MPHQHPSRAGQYPPYAGGDYSYAAQQNPQYNYQEYQYGHGADYNTGQADPSASNWTRGWLTFSDPCYLKGFLVGAGAALILTNTTVQKTLIKGVVKLWSGVEYGLEEVKEQIKDLKAEADGDKEGGS